MDAPSPSGVNSDKPRLSEQEKKSNHIASEQKRRQAIREGFDAIADLVPGYKGHGRSEAHVLQGKLPNDMSQSYRRTNTMRGAIAHIRHLLAERYELIQQGQAQGSDVKNFMLDDQTMSIARAYAAQAKHPSSN